MLMLGPLAVTWDGPGRNAGRIGPRWCQFIMPLFRWILSSIMGKPARVASLIDVSVTRSRPGCFPLRLVDGGGVEQGRVD